MDSIAESIVMIGDVGMSDKALLVMDMPEKCEKCTLCDFGDYTCGAFEILGKKYTYEVPDDGVADWCPLKPMPDLQDCKNVETLLDLGWAEGWNACIDKILGGESND